MVKLKLVRVKESSIYCNTPEMWIGYKEKADAESVSHDHPLGSRGKKQQCTKEQWAMVLPVNRSYQCSDYLSVILSNVRTIPETSGAEESQERAAYSRPFAISSKTLCTCLPPLSVFLSFFSPSFSLSFLLVFFVIRLVLLLSNGVFISRN